MKHAAFDSGGYPTLRSLRHIEQWTGFAVDLCEFVAEAWRYPHLAGSTTAGNIVEWEFVTGGWSGNEALIDAMADNPLFWALCWESSHRGGRHVFSFDKHTTCGPQAKHNKL